MTAQMPLDLAPPPPVTPLTPNQTEGLTLEQKFWLFHRQNPDVYARLRDMALQLKRRGHRRYGIKGLFEVLRWQYAMQTEDPTSEFKLNNNYHSFYARLLMEREAELKEFFETRTQRWRTHHSEGRYT